MSEMIERVARAIREAEIGYSIRLTRLVDEVATYTLTRPGHEPLDFSSHDEALEYVSDLRDTERARAAIEAMREPTSKMCFEGAKAGWAERNIETATATDVWKAMIDVALRVSDGNPSGAKTEGLRREAMTARPDEGGGRPSSLPLEEKQ